MIEVSQVAYGCQWDEKGHVKAWPLRIRFGAVGEEVTVDQMLEGRGYTVMLIDQLAALVQGMTPMDTPIELCAPVPAGVGHKLLTLGYFVQVIRD